MLEGLKKEFKKDLFKIRFNIEDEQEAFIFGDEVIILRLNYNSFIEKIMESKKNKENIIYLLKIELLKLIENSCKKSEKIENYLIKYLYRKLRRDNNAIIVPELVFSRTKEEMYEDISSLLIDDFSKKTENNKKLLSIKIGDLKLFFQKWLYSGKTLTSIKASRVNLYKNSLERKKIKTILKLQELEKSYDFEVKLSEENKPYNTSITMEENIKEVVLNFNEIVEKLKIKEYKIEGIKSCKKFNLSSLINERNFYKDSIFVRTKNQDKNVFGLLTLRENKYASFFLYRVENGIKKEVNKNDMLILLKDLEDLKIIE